MTDGRGVADVGRSGRRGGLRDGLAVITIVLLAASVIGATAVLTQPSASGPVIPASELPVAPGLSTLLLDTAEINDIVGSGDIEPKREYDFQATEPDAVNPSECGPVALPALALNYSKADWVAVTVREFSRPSRDYFVMAEAALALSSPEKAREFFEASKESWQSCHEKLFSFDPYPVRWYMRDYTAADNRISGFTLAEKLGVGCQRVFGVVASYVIDVGVCINGGADEAARIAESIMARVDAR